MRIRITLIMLTALCIMSCSDQTDHDIALDRSYQPFSTVTSLSKTLVQEVLVAAYQNPDLISLQGEVASNRADCPAQDDQNPGIFPKTLLFTYTAGCNSDSNNEMDGDLDVYVSERIGVDGMEIILNPRENFTINGNQLSLKGDKPEFKATYVGSSIIGVDSYDLAISGMSVLTPEQKTYQIVNMQQGAINFRDTDGNNDPSTGPITYLDDQAVIDFGIMSYENNVGEVLTVTVDQEITFDLFCDCPLAGRVEVRSEAGKTQVIDYNSNTNCGGKIIVDAEEIECN